MVLVYSTTKGLAAMTLALAHSCGWLDHEERVSTHWPEFAQQGKGRNIQAQSKNLMSPVVASIFINTQVRAEIGVIISYSDPNIVTRGQMEWEASK